MKKNNFKDKCDCCNQFNFCSGFNNKVLCDECIKKCKHKIKDQQSVYLNNKSNDEPIKGQTTIFDYL